MERIHKITNDFGMVDYYKYYSNHTDSPESRNIFNKIITDFNTELQDMIIEENLVYLLPKLNLELMLKKQKRKPRIVNGKLINNLPIDWKATNNLWDKDQEAKDKKLLIRINNSHTDGHVFRIYCKKFKSTIKFRGLYKWETVRNFARKVSKAIKDPDKNIDAYLLF